MARDLHEVLGMSIPLGDAAAFYLKIKTAEKRRPVPPAAAGVRKIAALCKRVLHKTAAEDSPLEVVNDRVRPQIGLDAPMPLHHQEGLFIDGIQPALDPVAFEELQRAAQGDELQEQNEAEFFRQQAEELRQQNQGLQQSLEQFQQQAEQQSQAQEQQTQVLSQQVQEQQMATQEAQQIADQRTQESLQAAQEAFKQRQLAATIRGAALQFKAQVSSALQNDPTEALLPLPTPPPPGMVDPMAPPGTDPAQQMQAQAQAQGQPGAPAPAQAGPPGPPGQPQPAQAAAAPPPQAPAANAQKVAALRRLDKVKVPSHIFSR